MDNREEMGDIEKIFERTERKVVIIMRIIVTIILLIMEINIILYTKLFEQYVMKRRLDLGIIMKYINITINKCNLKCKKEIIRGIVINSEKVVSIKITDMALDNIMIGVWDVVDFLIETNFTNHKIMKALVDEGFKGKENETGPKVESCFSNDDEDAINAIGKESYDEKRGENAATVRGVYITDEYVLIKKEVRNKVMNDEFKTSIILMRENRIESQNTCVLYARIYSRINGTSKVYDAILMVKKRVMEGYNTDEVRLLGVEGMICEFDNLLSFSMQTGNKDSELEVFERLTEILENCSCQYSGQLSNKNQIILITNEKDIVLKYEKAERYKNVYRIVIYTTLEQGKIREGKLLVDINNKGTYLIIDCTEIKLDDDDKNIIRNSLVLYILTEIDVEKEEGFCREQIEKLDNLLIDD